MAITDEGGGTGMYMPVAPAYGNNNGGFGFGGDWAWIILLLVLCGGWGNGFGGGGMWGGDGLYPWMNNSQNINEGFRDQMMHNTLTGIGDKIVAGQMDAMQTAFGLQSQLAQCCCDNRMATQDLKYTIATEECATRAANSANTQAILDKLCQLELDGYKREVDSLRSELTTERFKASQTAQNAFIAQGLTNEVDALYNRLSNCPVPSVPVYGRQPIFSCGNNNMGCGCGG